MSRNIYLFDTPSKIQRFVLMKLPAAAPCLPCCRWAQLSFFDASASWVSWASAWRWWMTFRRWYRKRGVMLWIPCSMREWWLWRTPVLLCPISAAWSFCFGCETLLIQIQLPMLARAGSWICPTLSGAAGNSCRRLRGGWSTGIADHDELEEVLVIVHCCGTSINL